MSRPSFENIDRWLFEYLEGNLSAAQELQLMDFLTIHPELMSELKAWNSAKVKAPAQQQFESKHLIKPVPLFFRPLSLVSIAIFAITLAWLGFNLYPSSPLYSMTGIDAEVIDFETEDDDLFFNQLFVTTNNSKQEKEISGYMPEANVIHKTNADSKTNDINSNKYIISRDKTTSNNLPSTYSVQDKQDHHLNGVISNINDEVYHQQESNDIQKDLVIEVNDLATISGYLNDKDKIIESPHFDKVLTSIDSRRAVSTSATKSSFMKSLNKTIREIKRMANYPVALQNTKKPHFHVPMMTGFNPNFAMVGTSPGNRIQTTSRVQWLNKSNSQLLNSLSWDGYVPAIRGGLGVDVNYNNYQNNDLNNYSAGITYSPKLSLNKKISFEPAVRFKMGVVNIDQQADIIGSPIELDRKNIIPLFQNEDQVTGHQLWYRDFGLGFIINTEWFYAGFNTDNIGRHDNNFYSSDLNKNYKADLHYTAILGTEYASKTKEIKFSGYGLYQNYGSLNELWLGSNFKYNWLQIGAAASSNGDLASSLGVVFNRFDIHYNIDFTKSRLLNKKFFSHQLTMKILLKPSRHVAKLLKH